MNEPLDKWTKITLAVFLCVVVLVLLGNQDRMHIYSTWTVPNGHLEYNRERSLNPLEWSAVFWTAGAGKA